MIIPKVLAQNSGFDPQDSIVKLQVMVMMTLYLVVECCERCCTVCVQEEYVSSGQPVGIDVTTGGL